MRNPINSLALNTGFIGNDLKETAVAMSCYGDLVYAKLSA